MHLLLQIIFIPTKPKEKLFSSKNANKSFFKNTTTYNGLWNTDIATTVNNNKMLIKETYAIY